ncbi:MAG: hypothetical protein AB7P99_14380 [Vicinamibacterales bacterium]
MNSSAQLTFADVIDRGAPLSAAEAATLVLAVSRLPIAAEDEIVLDGSGEVRLRVSDPRTFEPPDPRTLALLLHRLLRLDEPGGGDRRGCIPGGLLVVLARTLGQIDLPPLSRDAFDDAMVRFARSDGPVSLAAVFWRAARMRPRGSRRLAWGRRPAPRARTERRRQGPTTAEVRSWLRQAEQELFRLRRSRAATLAAAAMLALIVVAIFGIGAAVGRDAEVPLVAAAPAMDIALPVVEEASPPPAATLSPAPSAQRARAAARRTTVEAAAPPPRPVRRTVQMVNLPRAPWTVVRRLDTADER